MLPFHEPQFQIAKVADATGVPGTTIRQWYAREIWTLGRHDKEAVANGHARLLSAPTAIGLAITKALSDHGIKPARAAIVAKRFVLTDDGGKRAPGKLFKEGRTVLVVRKEYEEVIHAQIVNVTLDTKLMSALAKLPATEDPSPVILLDLTEVVIGVLSRLGFDPDEAWGEE